MTDAQNLTANQTAVLTVLEGADKAMTAYEILDALHGSGIRAPAQVYRALEKLSAQGCIHRVESLNAFVACTGGHEDKRHIHSVALAICDDCGSVTEISLPNEVRRLNALTQEAGFVTDHAVVELRGHCAPCRSAAG